MRSTSLALASGSGARPGQSTAMLPGASGQTCGAPGAHGLAQVDRRRALLVVDRDELGAVLRGGQRLGDHDRDRLADVPHGLAGERRADAER